MLDVMPVLFVCFSSESVNYVVKTGNFKLLYCVLVGKTAELIVVRADSDT